MEAIKLFLDNTDSEYQQLQQTNPEDLQELIDNKQSNGSVKDDLTEAIKQIIASLQSYLNKESFAGKFHQTGSTFIKSDTPKNQDYDYLFIHSGIKNFELRPYRQEKFPDLYRGVGPADAPSLYRQFKEYIEMGIEKMKSQGKLALAGYGNPNYNGLRRNGPAVTCLIQHASTGDKVITLDLTLGLPAPKEIQAPIIQRLEASPVWGSHVQYLPDEDKVIHIVPTYKPKKKKEVWLLSSAVLETQILPNMEITETIRAIKVLGNFLSLKSSSQRYSQQIEFNKKATKVHSKLFGRLSKTPEDREKLGCNLFKKHILLPEYMEEDYLEKTKQIISVSGAAVKFFVLCELRDGNCTAGDEISWTTVHRFFSSLVDDLNTALNDIPQELKTLAQQETPLSRPYVEHPFLSSKVRKLNFANYAVGREDLVLSFVETFHDRCNYLMQHLSV